MMNATSLRVQTIVIKAMRTIPMTPMETAPSTGVNWALSDNQGTVRDVIDSSGVVLNHLVYDSYGQVTSETNPSLDFRFGYTGRERDKETGLQYNRARYYDSFTGGFIGQDPIGFGGGDANLYRYVGNSPLNGTDPAGLEEWWQRIGNTVAGGLRNIGATFANSNNPYVDATRRLIQNPVQTIKDGIEGGTSLINEAAENAQKHYADRLVNPNTPALEKPFDALGGMLSSLATKGGDLNLISPKERLETRID
jgi:RHS repeat-associated protein